MNNKIYEEFENGYLINLHIFFNKKTVLYESEIINYINELSLHIDKIIFITISNTNITFIDSFIKFKNLKYLDISNNKINILPKLPKSITELDCSHNNLNDLKLDNLINIDKINCDNNNINYIHNKYVKQLSCSDNKINNLKCESLIKLYINNNLLTNLNNINKLISVLECSNNKIEDLPQFNNLSILFINDNKIKSVPIMDNLEELYIYNNDGNITIPYMKKLNLIVLDNMDSNKISNKYKICDISHQKNFIILTVE